MAVLGRSRYGITTYGSTVPEGVEVGGATRTLVAGPLAVRQIASSPVIGTRQQTGGPRAERSVIAGGGAVRVPAGG